MVPTDSQIELLSRPQELFQPESSHSSLKAHFGDEWNLGFMSHVMPFVSSRSSVLEQKLMI